MVSQLRAAPARSRALLRQRARPDASDVRRASAAAAAACMGSPDSGAPVLESYSHSRVSFYINNLPGRVFCIMNYETRGWNSWLAFGCRGDNMTGSITAQIIIETADAIVSSGLQDKGYEYV